MIKRCSKDTKVIFSTNKTENIFADIFSKFNFNYVLYSGSLNFIIPKHFTVYSNILLQKKFKLDGNGTSAKANKVTNYIFMNT